jgi:site-specific DNA recombinase
MASNKTAPVRTTTRCAIYTRKSTEEGLEQEFNSLDAQREACGAYILSQRHEGWSEVPELYDDGGYSGGTMERPALKRLLADIEAGKVDVIVLYKVDRLTRSLADFARIVEVLDKQGASFVSITQSFNTTTSMGRLTLNVLLSFAQFEREVTGERIRDKVAASKAKGMWMGGVVPLGYRVCERKLVIDPAEAETVRMIFKRYAKLGSTGELADELQRRGIVTKRRVLSNGRTYGGQAFTRGALAHLLQNHHYVGEVAHRDQIYPGEHEALIDRALWDKVQARLANNRRERRTSSRAQQPSMLAGMITDGFGRPMTPTHANRGTKRYRYYVSRCESGDAHRPWSIPAHAIEQLVLERLGQLIGEGAHLIDRLAHTSSETCELIRQRSTELARRIKELSPSAARPTILDLGVQVQVEDESLTLSVDVAPLITALLGADAKWLTVEIRDASPVQIRVPVKVKRRGQELRLVFRPNDPGAKPRVDEKLIDLIVKAHDARDKLSEGVITPAELPHVTRLGRLSYLAPDIVAAIVEGRQPADLCARAVLRAAHLPICWNKQREVLGFG